MDTQDRFGFVTPEAVEVDLDIAGLGSRLIASLVDGLAQAAILIGGFVAGSLDPAFGEGFALVVVGLMLVTMVLLGYHALFEGLWEGCTPGKRAAGIRVISADGQPVTWSQVLIRSVFRLIDLSPLGVVAILVTKRSQRLGDQAAGTIVIHEQRAPQPQPINFPSDPERDRLATVLDTSSVSEREYALVRSFLQRRQAMQGGARAEVAAKLAELLESKTGKVKGSLSDEQFLEAVLSSVRG
jgi:uncharacterized RDD family membrane protein YckC